MLLYQAPLGATARARLQAIRDSQDGFFIAEKDLELRGPAELLGSRKTGEEGFRLADPQRHAHLMREAVVRGDRLLAEAPDEAAALLQAWASGDSGHLSV
ncbi:MAG: hypothetical protein RLO46_16785 [Pseudomonadales bacterium]